MATITENGDFYTYQSCFIYMPERANTWIVEAKLLAVMTYLK